MLQRAPHTQEKLIFLKRLQDVVVSSPAYGLQRRGNIVNRCDHDHRNFRVILAKPFQELDAVHFRHDHVAQHQVWSCPLDLILGCAAVADCGAAVTLGLQHCGNDFADGFLVVDDKYIFDFHVWLAPGAASTQTPLYGTAHEEVGSIAHSENSM